MREEKRSQPEGLEFVCKVVLQQLVEADLSLTMYVSPPDSIPSSPPPFSHLLRCKELDALRGGSGKLPHFLCKPSDDLGGEILCLHRCHFVF